MTRFSFPGLPAFWLCAAGLLTGLAHAQAPAAAPPMDALAYRSALADYQAYKDQPVQPWRETNDTVGRIGGWRAYAREAAQATPADAGKKPANQASPAVPPPAADPHAGHHGSQP